MPVQSEAALENGLIDTLQKMNYEYVHIEEEKNLSANFKKQLEKHNKKKLEELGRTEFTDSEFEKILIYLEVALALKRQRNCVTSFLLNWKTENACGWSS